MLIPKFAPPSLIAMLEDTVASSDFPWFWNGSTVIFPINDTFRNEFQFIHTFVRNSQVTSEYYEIIRDVVVLFESKTGLHVKSIHRAKANLMVRSTWTEKEFEESIHTDEDDPKYISLVYYVIDSDGDTVILDDDKTTVLETASPVQGDLLYFSSAKHHRPTPPKEYNRRIVLNIVVEI